jgi:hypothetical protein
MVEGLQGGGHPLPCFVPEKTGQLQKNGDGRNETSHPQLNVRIGRMSYREEETPHLLFIRNRK